MNPSDNKDNAEKKSVQDISSIFFLTTDYVFSREDGGFLQVAKPDGSITQVILKRIMPFKYPYKYISVNDFEEKEIGIIRDINEFPPDQAELLKSELELRYHCPEIYSITSVKHKMGYVYFSVGTSNGKKDFALRDVTKNIRFIGENKLLIVDVDGNRYIINDPSKLDKASARRIDNYIY